MQSFVPKARRPRFDLILRIHDLNNVPLVSGSCFIKWHLPSSTAAEHRGRTQKCTIKDHKVDFSYEKNLEVRLVVGKDQMLQEAWINFEVLQEYSSGGKGERLTLGNIKLNLAEYVEASEQSHGSGRDEEGVTRRYLMQDSKINSTLKIGIIMKHVEGDKNYYAPPLRTAPVFGGITGIMSSAEIPATDSPTDAEAPSAIPSLSSKSRDAGEMQDMYRRNLVASWVAQPGELKADDCIEDIFKGGDGWGSHLGRPGAKVRLAPDDTEVVEEGSRSRASSTNLAPPGETLHPSPRSKSPSRRIFGHSHKQSKDNKSLLSMNGEREKKHTGFGDSSQPGAGGLGHRGVFGGRTSLHQAARRVEMENAKMMKARKEGRGGQREAEVDEFDNPYREDLRAWKILI